MNPITDFSADWTACMLSDLEKQGYQVSSLESEEAISYKFFNVRRRRISVSPRAIHESTDLCCPEKQRKGYEALKAKLASGEDVTPHQSRLLLDASYNDPLLNDWGIQHFHLGETVGTSKFIGRTGPLLFALIKQEAAYCIAVLPHGAWSEQELLKIVHRNWPEAISNFRLRGALGLSEARTNRDIAVLRKAGIQTLVEVAPNVVYGPIGGGYSTAGTSIAVTMQSDRYRELVTSLEIDIHKNIQQFLQTIAERGLTAARPPKFVLHVNDEGFLAVETGSNVAFLLHRHGG